MFDPYDLLVVLGYAFTEEGELPSHVKPRLEKAAQLYKKGIAKKIALCGKWSLKFDHKEILPPHTEAEKMRQILTTYDISNEHILKEEWSKDTIGNAYYLKKKIAQKYGFKKLLIVCADFHIARVKYIFYKIFGPTYEIDFLGTATDLSFNEAHMKNQLHILNDQIKFLSNLKEDNDLDGLYDGIFYNKGTMKNVSSSR